jgi:hypothetical protein
MAVDLRAFLGQHAEQLFPPGSNPRRHRDYRTEFRNTLVKMHQLRMEALRLYLSLPHAEEFHQSRAKWRLAIGSNRAGKSLSCGVEFSRAVIGMDPYDKYPRNGGNAIVVGADSDHLAMQWRTISEEGAFYIIQDEQTRLWRAVRPHPNDPTQLDDYDDAYREKWKPAPPLIPRRMYAKPAMEDAGKGVPRVVNFHTGWKSLWRTGNGHPQKGAHYNLGWLDEDMQNDQFYEEVNRGLVGLNEPEKWAPKGIWSATPQTDNMKLIELRELSDAGAEHIKSFFFTIDQNPYVPASERRAFFESMNEQEREVRYYGRSAIEGRYVYSMYDPQGVHGCEPGDILPNCAHYLFADPGSTCAAALFVAVDPFEQHAWVYNGFTVKNCTIQQWAGEVAQRCPDVLFEAAIMDQQAGRCKHGYGGEVTTAKQWWDALIRAGVRVKTQGNMGGSGFYASNPDIAYRQAALQDWMLPRDSGEWRGTSKLKVVRGCFPDLDKQIRHAQMQQVKRTDRTVRTEKRASRTEDALVCLEYAAAFSPSYREPEKLTEHKDLAVYRMFQEKQKKSKKRLTAGVCLG